MATFNASNEEKIIAELLKKVAQRLLNFIESEASS